MDRKKYIPTKLNASWNTKKPTNAKSLEKKFNSAKKASKAADNQSSSSQLSKKYTPRKPLIPLDILNTNAPVIEKPDQSNTVADIGNKELTYPFISDHISTLEHNRTALLKKGGYKKKQFIQSKSQVQEKLDIAYSKYLQNVFLDNLLTREQKNVSNLQNDFLIKKIELNQDLQERVHLSKLVIQELKHIKDYLSNFHLLQSNVKHFIYDVTNKNLIDNFKYFTFRYGSVRIPNIRYVENQVNFELLQDIFSEDGALTAYLKDFPDHDIYYKLCEILSKTKDVIPTTQNNITNFESNTSELLSLILQSSSNKMSFASRNIQPVLTSSLNQLSRISFTDLQESLPSKSLATVLEFNKETDNAVDAKEKQNENSR